MAGNCLAGFLFTFTIWTEEPSDVITRPWNSANREIGYFLWKMDDIIYDFYTKIIPTLQATFAEKMSFLCAIAPLLGPNMHIAAVSY